MLFPFLKKISNFLKLPTPKQWKKFFSVLSKKEESVFIFFLALSIISSLVIGINYYLENTVIKPTDGGEIKEGVIGQPRFMNPLFLSDNDADRDIVELVFSGFFKYDDNGKIINDLAKSYKIENNGKTYKIKLKKDIKWQDGKPLTADDVIFTMKIIQAPQYKSPLRVEWFGINVKKTGENEVSFNLQKRYYPFLGKLAKLKILPRHIFENISPDNFPWVLSKEKYLIGSGPFKIKKIEKENRDSEEYIKKIVLERNNYYYGEKPYIKQFSFVFYDNFDGLLEAIKKKEIDSFPILNPKYVDAVEKEGFKLYKISLPRYFALFFNLKNENSLIREKIIRESISLLIDKDKILKKVFFREGRIVDSPILNSYFNFKKPAVNRESYNPEKAVKLLENNGFKINPATGFREKIKKNESIIFSRNLMLGSKGEEVKKLQECLSRDNKVYPEKEISGYFGKKTRKAVIRFQEKYANDILKPIGLSKGTGDVKSLTRKKLNQICQSKPEETIPLKIEVATSNKFPLKEIAKLIKEDLEKYGFAVRIKEISLADLQTDVLAKRNFEALLFGEALNEIPDPFPFWHSSQKNYPGLNITGYQSKKADEYLEKARESLTKEENQKYLQLFQSQFLEDTPAVLLVRPEYLYFVSPKIKGFNIKKMSGPEKRFSQIEKVYIETARKWK